MSSEFSGSEYSYAENVRAELSSDSDSDVLWSKESSEEFIRGKGACSKDTRRRVEPNVSRVREADTESQAKLIHEGEDGVCNSWSFLYRFYAIVKFFPLCQAGFRVERNP